MQTTHRPQRIFLLIIVLLLMSTIACRATQRLNGSSTTGSETTTAQNENVEGETAVSTPLSASVSEPAQTADADPLGDELENLLDGLIRQNDQADDLEDFPTFEN